MITEQEIFSSKILIIDDEMANIKLLEQLLTQNGYKNLISITDPREAIKTYQEVNPDLVLLDLNMPHKDGFTLLEEFNHLERDNYPPVMVLTAQGEKGARIKALKAGARDFLSKPFDLIEVSLRIKNMLEIRLLNNRLLMYSRILEEKIQERSVDLVASQLRLEHKIEERKK